jgi:2-polyprenyl-3-methyl-5-hydroxy-6-metoxy-1,4-benzoquinol methylase
MMSSVAFILEHRIESLFKRSGGGDMSGTKNPVDKHYDAVAKEYHQLYERDRLYDLTSPYPANYFRLQLLLNSFVTKGIKRAIEVGVGEGTPLTTLGKAGIDIWGFDISREMVNKSKDTIQKNGMNPDHIFWGDIQDPITYAHALKDGPFDGLMAMGVMPHVENDDLVLDNIASLVRPGGSVFVEFRNKLFSLFTLNRYTVDFILNDLLAEVDAEIKNIVQKDLESRLRIDRPISRDKIEGSNEPGYDSILSKFHNPFEIVEKFAKHGFTGVRLLWYHYHPAMPYLEEKMPSLFRKEAMRLEHDPSNWRGYFLCSAFVVEAVKG